ncbi:MAG: tetratricopeptide repeat protein [Chloroflexi bacterium]|nr:tetratricopeptide repeat protein [Chloroflexota bacterium]
MKPLSPPDSLHLSAAEGWLGLGNFAEANEELERITPPLRAHRDVLEVRWQVYAAGMKWEACLDIATALTKRAPDRPFGWIHRAYALHELKRTAEALESLLPAADKFAVEYLIPYNLACYSAQLGQLTEAKAWLERAFQVSGHAAQVKLAALDDPDLEPLWQAIGELPT